MKNWGIFLIIVGIICGYTAISMDTSVETGGTYEYGTYIPKTKVNNIGLMNQQTNLLIFAGISFISGILLIGFSYKSIASFSKGVRTCPYCAEQVKAEALICRFCQRDLPALTEDDIVSLQKPNNYGNKWLWIGILFISAIIIKDIIDRPKDEIDQKLDELKQKQKQIISQREKQCISNAEISWYGYSYGINRLEFSNPYQDEKERSLYLEGYKEGFKNKYDRIDYMDKIAYKQYYIEKCKKGNQ